MQGLAVDPAAAVGVALALWLPDADLSSREAWMVLGLSVGKSVLTALASYLQRAKLDGATGALLPPARQPARLTRWGGRCRSPRAPLFLGGAVAEDAPGPLLSCVRCQAASFASCAFRIAVAGDSI